MDDELDFSPKTLNRRRSTFRIQEKGRGKSKRTVGIHPEAAEALHEYLEHAGIESGPIFRAKLNPRSKKLGKKRIAETTMYRLLMSYLVKLPRSHKTIEYEDGTTERKCIFTPHSASSDHSNVAAQEWCGQSRSTTTPRPSSCNYHSDLRQANSPNHGQCLSQDSVLSLPGR